MFTSFLLFIFIPLQDDPDCGIYWHVNFDRFHHHFRDQAIISAVASKFDRVSDIPSTRVLARIKKLGSQIGNGKFLDVLILQGDNFCYF